MQLRQMIDVKLVFENEDLLPDDVDPDKMVTWNVTTYEES